MLGLFWLLVGYLKEWNEREMIQDRSNTKLKVVVAKENYSRKVKVTPLQFLVCTTLMAQFNQNSRSTRFIGVLYILHTTLI